MTSFQVGDVVQHVANDGPGYGAVGVVKDIVTYYPSIGVSWSGFDNGHNLGGRLTGENEKLTGWYSSIANLILFPGKIRKPKVSKTKCQCGEKMKKKIIKGEERYFCPVCLDKSGSLGALHRAINLEKKPGKTPGKIVTFDRYVGVEIEAAGPGKKRLSTCLDIPTDCGIGQDAGGIEVKTPPRKKRTFETMIRKSCQILKKANFSPDNNCGLHVHIDFTKERRNNKKMHNFHKTYYAVEDMIFFSLPQRRRRHPYTSFMSTGRSFFSDEVGGLALRNQLDIYGTLEVRSHEGTLDEEDILSWTQLLLAIADYAMNNYKEKDVLELFKYPNGSREKREAIYKLLKFSPKLIKYIERRTDQFKAKSNDPEVRRDNFVTFSQKNGEITPDGKAGKRVTPGVNYNYYSW